jgi:hypothetical protein
MAYEATLAIKWEAGWCTLAQYEDRAEMCENQTCLPAAIRAKIGSVGVEKEYFSAFPSVRKEARIRTECTHFTSAGKEASPYSPNPRSYLREADTQMGGTSGAE